MGFLDWPTTPAYWAQHITADRPFSPPAEIADPDRILAGYRALWALDDAAPHCLSHGDTHVGNISVESDRVVRFMDWASPNLDPWPHDVAYFLGFSLSIEDRREHERALLDNYLTALAGHGGPALDPGAAWLDYRRHHLHGLIWMAVPASMHPVENVTAISRRAAATTTRWVPWASDSLYLSTTYVISTYSVRACAILVMHITSSGRSGSSWWCAGRTSSGPHRAHVEDTNT